MVERNADLRSKILNFYSNLLYKECGLNYNSAVGIYGKIGNSTGVYPDTLLLFVKMIKHYKLKNIIEFGSGMSTLFLTKIAKDLNITFVSYEEKKRYLNMTIELLESFNLKPNIKLFDKGDLLNLQDVDFIFIDCSGDLRRDLSIQTSICYSSTLIIIIDDINDYPSLVTHFKDPFCFYNGTGRLDRYQFIKYPEKINFSGFLTQEMGYL